VGTFISELVQRPVQRLERLAVTLLFAGLRTTPSLLPKLDVEGSSPFARFFTPAVPSMATAG